jgi:hypothetical protein
MLRRGLSGAFALTLMTLGSSAQSNVDCATRYKTFLEKLTREKQGKMSGEQLAALNRRAHRIYDACQTGHLADPKALFDALDRSKN